MSGMIDEVRKYVQVTQLSVQLSHSAKMAEMYGIWKEDSILFEGTETFLIKLPEGYLTLTEATELNSTDGIIRSEIIEHRVFQDLAFAVAYALKMVVCYRIGCQLDIESEDSLPGEEVVEDLGPVQYN